MSKANGSEALVAEQLSKDRAVIELCRRSLVNHFVVRDMDAALAYMADDVEWLGPFRVIGKKVCPEPNRNPCDKGRLHAGHSIAQQCPSAPPLHLFR